MYSRGASIVYGFHGCDRNVADNVISAQNTLSPSKNAYDWLGSGIYFWENSPSRALEYAEHLKKHSKQAQKPIQEPAVIGAVIDLGNCLDLLDYKNLQLLSLGYEILQDAFIKNSQPLPTNKRVGTLNELLLRELDCAVIETLHETRKKHNLAPYDSVRGVFWEGEELYPNAGFRKKDHIQICIRNPNCIKGFFYPRETDEHFPAV